VHINNRKFKLYHQLSNNLVEALKITFLRVKRRELVLLFEITAAQFIAVRLPTNIFNFM